MLNDLIKTINNNLFNNEIDSLTIIETCIDKLVNESIHNQSLNLTNLILSNNISDKINNYITNNPISLYIIDNIQSFLYKQININYKSINISNTLIQLSEFNTLINLLLSNNCLINLSTFISTNNQMNWEFGSLIGQIYQSSRSNHIELDISDNNLLDKGIQLFILSIYPSNYILNNLSNQLTNYTSITNILSINLSNNNLTDMTILSLTKAWNDSCKRHQPIHLHTLNLSRNKITSYGAQLLAQFVISVSSIFIPSYLSNKTVYSIYGQVDRHKNVFELKQLILDDNNIDMKGINSLLSILSIYLPIQKLSLDRNIFNFSLFHSLTNYLSITPTNSQLKSINLSFTPESAYHSIYEARNIVESSKVIDRYIYTSAISKLNKVILERQVKNNRYVDENIDRLVDKTVDNQSDSQTDNTIDSKIDSNLCIKFGCLSNEFIRYLSTYPSNYLSINSSTNAMNNRPNYPSNYPSINQTIDTYIDIQQSIYLLCELPSIYSIPSDVMLWTNNLQTNNFDKQSDRYINKSLTSSLSNELTNRIDNQIDISNISTQGKGYEGDQSTYLYEPSYYTSDSSLSNHIDIDVDSNSNEIVNVKTLNQLDIKSDKKIDHLRDSQLTNKIDSKLDNKIVNNIDRKIGSKSVKAVDRKFERKIVTDKVIEKSINLDVKPILNINTTNRPMNLKDLSISPTIVSLDSESITKTDTSTQTSFVQMNSIDSQIKNYIDNQLDSKIDIKIDSKLNSKLSSSVDSQIDQPVDTEITVNQQVNSAIFNEMSKNQSHQLDSKIVSTRSDTPISVLNKSSIDLKMNENEKLRTEIKTAIQTLNDNTRTLVKATGLLSNKDINSLTTNDLLDSIQKIDNKTNKLIDKKRDKQVVNKINSDLNNKLDDKIDDEMASNSANPTKESNSTYNQTYQDIISESIALTTPQAKNSNKPRTAYDLYLQSINKNDGNIDNSMDIKLESNSNKKLDNELVGIIQSTISNEINRNIIPLLSSHFNNSSSPNFQPIQLTNHMTTPRATNRITNYPVNTSSISSPRSAIIPNNNSISKNQFLTHSPNNNNQMVNNNIGSNFISNQLSNKLSNNYVNSNNNNISSISTIYPNNNSNYISTNTTNNFTSNLPNTPTKHISSNLSNDIPGNQNSNIYASNFPTNHVPINLPNDIPHSPSISKNTFNNQSINFPTNLTNINNAVLSIPSNQSSSHSIINVNNNSLSKGDKLSNLSNNITSNQLTNIPTNITDDFVHHINDLPIEPANKLALTPRYKYLLDRVSYLEAVNITGNSSTSVDNIKSGIDTNISNRIDTKIDRNIDSTIDNNKTDITVDNKLDNNIDNKIDTKINKKVDNKPNNSLDTIKITNRLDNEIVTHLLTDIARRQHKQMKAFEDRHLNKPNDKKLINLIDYKVDNNVDSFIVNKINSLIDRSLSDKIESYINNNPIDRLVDKTPIDQSNDITTLSKAIELATMSVNDLLLEYRSMKSNGYIDNQIDEKINNHKTNNHDKSNQIVDEKLKVKVKSNQPIVKSTVRSNPNKSLYNHYKI